MSNPYSAEKALAHGDRLDVLARGGQPPPVHLHLVVSDLCNHDCPWCAYRAEGYTSEELFSERGPGGERIHNPDRRIIPGKVVEILQSAKSLGIRAVQFTGGGEPSVHPQLPFFLQMAKTLGLEAALVTNGSRLGPELRAAILEACTWVRVSIDAGTEETHTRTRGLKTSHWGRVWEGVRAVIAERGGAERPYIGLGFVVNRDNWREIAPFAEMAFHSRADGMRLSAVFSSEGPDYYRGIREEVEAACARATEEWSRPGFRVVNGFAARAADLDEGRPDYRSCGYQHFTTYVGADLNLYRCCVQAYSTKGKVASLKDQTLEQAWKSEQKERDMAKFDARGCERCMFNEKNRQIAEAVREWPGRHGFFV